jgi:hypothetical protein
MFNLINKTMQAETQLTSNTVAVKPQRTQSQKLNAILRLCNRIMLSHHEESDIYKLAYRVFFRNYGKLSNLHGKSKKH